MATSNKTAQMTANQLVKCLTKEIFFGGDMPITYSDGGIIVTVDGFRLYDANGDECNENGNGAVEIRLV